LVLAAAEQGAHRRAEAVLRARGNAVPDPRSLLERSPDAGGLRVLYWGNRFSYPPSSA
jgi:hypothetical protein